MADERVEIQIHVDGKNAVATLKELEDYINRLNGKKVDIGVNAGGSRGSGGRSGYPGSELSRLGESLWNRELLADQKRIARMEAERTKNARTSYENWWKTTLAEQERREKALEKYKTDSAVLRQRIAAEQIRKEETWDKEQAQNRIVAMQREADAWANYYGRRSTTTQFLTNLIGGAVSGLGNISNGTASLASGIGSAFSGMGSMFHMDLLGTAQRYLTAMATRMVTGNIGASVSRADIMNTFVPYMALAGVDKSVAQTALNRINQSILGLPIGLDEAAQRLRRYQMFMGDTEAATNMTIGIQNAIMAGGASEQMKTQAYYQIDRLLSAGRLSTSRQWLSLLQGLGVSTRFLAQEMGDASLTAKEMAAGLTSGEISTEDFLKAVQRLAYNQDITKALDVYKNTYESWISNIGFAFKRGNANVLNALSDSLNVSTGTTTLGYMQLFRNGVNTAYTGATNWLANNPSVIGNTVSSVQGLGGALGNINYGGIATSIFGNIGRVVDYVATSINRISGGKLEDFVSFATTLAAPVGGVFKAVSGGLPALLGVYDRFKDFNFEGLMDNITKAVGSMANLVSGGLGLIGDNFMSKLLAYGLVWGRPAGAALGAIGNGVRGVGNILNLYNQGMGALASGNYGVSPLSAFLYGKGFDKTSVKEAQKYLATLLPTVGKTAAGAVLGSAATVGGLYALARFVAKPAYENAVDEYYGRTFNPNTIPAMQSAGVGVTELIEQSRVARQGRDENYPTLSNSVKSIEGMLKENAEYRTSIFAENEDLFAAYNAGLKEYREAVAKQEAFRFEPESVLEQSIEKTALDQRVEELKEELYGSDGLAQKVAAVNEELAKLGEQSKKYQEQLELLGAESYATATPEQKKAIMDAYIANSATWEAENADTFAELAAGWGGTGMMDPIVKSYFDPSKYGTDSIINQRQSHVDAMNAYTSSMDTLFDVIKNGPDDEQTRNLAEYVSTLSSKGLKGAAELEGLARLFEGNEPELAWQAVEAYMAEKEAMQEVEDKSKELTRYSLEVASGQKEVADASMDAAGAMSAAQAASASAKDAIYAAGEASAGATPKVSGLGSAAGDAAGQLGAAAGQANALAAAINALPTYKKIIIDIESRQRGAGLSSYQSGLLGGNKPIAITQSRGGMIYAANGMFIPHGTDTVPAMLTPGEYVVRRKAAAAFGKAFMDRVNALDIHGAFRALSHRMSVPSTGSFIANNQRTYDNHASVTQNIVTNSQSFTHRRARRWVRALT